MGQPIEPVEITLDKPRRVLLDLPALYKAEREINRRRGIAPTEYVSIDYLILSAARKNIDGEGGFPLDLIVVLLWAGLSDDTLTPEKTLELIDQSQVTRGEVVDIVWEAYARTAGKGKEEGNKEPPADGGEPVSQT